MLCLTRGSMPKISPSITRLLTIAMFVTSAFADTVTLKSGEHIEGKITKETDKDVTIEIRSGGVVDERTVTKAEIEKIDKISPEVEAYRAIDRIRLQLNSFPAAQYEPYIAALDAFVKQYPNSVRTIDVQTTLNAFQAELKRVEGGEVKLDGNWLSKAEVQKEKVQIDGRIAFNYMKARSAAGDYVDALNAFATMQKSYAGATTMPDAVELALKIIPALKAQVERAIPEQKILQDQRDKGVKTASTTDRPEMEAAVKKEDESAEAAAKAADTSGRWAPFIKISAPCLISLQKKAENEEKRLLALKLGPMRESVKLAEDARQKLANGDKVGAEAELKDASRLWQANELAKRLSADMVAEKTTVSVPVSIPAASEPAAAAAAATPEPKGPVKKMTPKPKASTPRPSAAVAEANGSSAPVAAKKDVEDAPPFYMTLPGAVAIVVGLAIVLGGANFVVKMKKRKAEEA
ncbi:hypothetical protein CfE428DRAFT_1468 [Chthoniobacter flavus Ellin428]|uniref:Uncharacterized protein n=2 Tax=Chthoniobacter flavus TaxID=191863 RepID=B4CY27_9BACT|nr:hypothetical protein CfE428DRAFT_1468 [Chthoniobacter flavus Ellin428]